MSVSNKRAVLLTMLRANLGQPVSMEAILNELYAERRCETAVQSVRSMVRILRGRLAEEGLAIVATSNHLTLRKSIFTGAVVYVERKAETKAKAAVASKQFIPPPGLFHPGSQPRFGRC